jgi:hypothetical protein
MGAFLIYKAVIMRKRGFQNSVAQGKRSLQCAAILTARQTADTSGLMPRCFFGHFDLLSLLINEGQTHMD